MQWYTGDWLKDPALGQCSPATRGIWADLLCLMHENGESGELTGTHASLARIARCTEAEMRAACHEISVTKAGHVTVGPENITVVNRRMSREASERVSARDRKRNQRARDAASESVTEKSRLLSSSSSSSSSSPPLSPPRDVGGEEADVMAVDSGSGDLTTTNSGSVAPTSCEARRPGKAKTRKKKHANGSATPAAESASCATWNAYADAYRHRYGQEPVRNARINGQLAQFVARVPQADAPHLAAWYCSHNGRWYCQKGHPIGALLADAESLHTQWRQGHMLTEAAARETDGLQKRGQQWQEFIEEGRRLDALAAAAGETNTPGGDDHGHH